MKYGIITHYGVLNHGAVLQLNALIQVLKSLGIEAKALQFEKNFDYIPKDQLAKYKISLKSIKVYLRFLLNRGLRNFVFLFRKTKILNRYKQEKCLIGKFYTEYEKLDGVVIGSDEVFALHSGPTPVFFGHALPSDKVFAYGGSFGPTTFDDILKLHCRPFVESGLRSMCGLGMRDQNSVDIGEILTGKRPDIVCDPVILYGYNKELEGKNRPMSSNYMIIYAYDQRMNDTDEVSAIRKYAKNHRLKIVSPGFYHRWADRNVNPSPDEILNWFQHADYVVTDTFHGAVMSIITGREVAVRIRDNGNKLMNLLSEYKIAERTINNDWNLDELFSRKIDWKYVNQQISQRRHESMLFLKRMIEL
jgi:hypothetical protein